MNLEKVATKLVRAVADQAGVGLAIDLLQEPRSKGWDPVIPHDLHTSKLPPVAADGTAQCWRCKARLAFEQLDICNEAYVCRPCAMLAGRAAAAAQTIDVDTVKIGHGRWWITPLAFALAIGICVAVYLT